MYNIRYINNYKCFCNQFLLSGIVESVGLGQSEVEIDQVVDMLLLVVPPGGGDDLQASKKGIVEAADMILINKADGDLLPLARSTKSDYAGEYYVNQYLLTYTCLTFYMLCRVTTLCAAKAQRLVTRCTYDVSTHRCWYR